MIYEYQSRIFNRKFVYYVLQQIYVFLFTVFVNDGSSSAPVMSTPVRAGCQVPRFASPSQIGMPSADSDRHSTIFDGKILSISPRRILLFDRSVFKFFLILSAYLWQTASATAVPVFIRGRQHVIQTKPILCTVSEYCLRLFFHGPFL